MTVRIDANAHENLGTRRLPLIEQRIPALYSSHGLAIYQRRGDPGEYCIQYTPYRIRPSKARVTNDIGNSSCQVPRSAPVPGLASCMRRVTTGHDVIRYPICSD